MDECPLRAAVSTGQKDTVMAGRRRDQADMHCNRKDQREYRPKNGNSKHQIVRLIRCLDVHLRHWQRNPETSAVGIFLPVLWCS